MAENYEEFSYYLTKLRDGLMNRSAGLASVQEFADAIRFKHMAEAIDPIAFKASSMVSSRGKFHLDLCIQEMEQLIEEFPERVERAVKNQEYQKAYEFTNKISVYKIILRKMKGDYHDMAVAS